MKIDVNKLEQFIKECVADVHGACVSSGATIGIINGKEIQIKVTCDEDDLTGVNEKWRFVTE